MKSYRHINWHGYSYWKCILHSRYFSQITTFILFSVLLFHVTRHVKFSFITNYQSCQLTQIIRIILASNEFLFWLLYRHGYIRWCSYQLNFSPQSSLDSVYPHIYEESDRIKWYNWLMTFFCFRISEWLRSEEGRCHWINIVLWILIQCS